MNSLFRSVLHVVWFRSLYRRIAFSFILMIAVLIATQTIIFLMVTDRARQLTDAEHSVRLGVTQAFAAELSQALESGVAFDLDKAVAERQSDRLWVMMRDRRLRGTPPSDSAIRSVTAQLEVPDRQVPVSWARGTHAAVPITVHEEVMGFVGIAPLTTFQRFSVPIVALGVACVFAGTFITTVWVVWPVRARLYDLREAARRLGQGDLSAQANADGADEISELAGAFNEMAHELAARANALEASDRLRRQLIADVSHELMTPLTSVLGHLETLMMEELHLSDAQRLAQVEISAREARRLERLIRDLLDAARLEAGGAELSYEEFSIVELFEQLRARYSYQCLGRGIRLHCSVSPQTLTIEADPFRLEQALDNVIVNAFRHTPDGGTITVNAELEGDSVVVSVSDTGEGVPPQDLPYIFDRFYKATAVRAIASAGSGLGLSIVKAIVLRHGGHVAATSTLGSGTTIRIELPARRSVGNGDKLKPDSDAGPGDGAIIESTLRV